MKAISATDVFQMGTRGVVRPPLTTTITISYPQPRQKHEVETLVFSPTEPGTYSVLLFLHGYLMLNRDYSQLLDHITSHGYIVVAPQLYHRWQLFFDGNEELELAAGVTNWIPKGLPSVVLPTGVHANVQSLALSGHSRGGKQAFALALGKAKTPITLKPSVLVGLDPVAGVNILGITQIITPPPVLTYSPESLELGIPAVVIGTGKGGWCTPKGLNHDDFFSESKPPRAHIVAKDYGHQDMLNDYAEIPERLLCEFPPKSFEEMDLSRRCFGGIFVAAARAFLQGKRDDFNAIVNNQVVPPVKLDPNYFDDGSNIIKPRL